MVRDRGALKQAIYYLSNSLSLSIWELLELTKRGCASRTKQCRERILICFHVVVEVGEKSSNLIGTRDAIVRALY
jgi:hypothetical protein